MSEPPPNSAAASAALSASTPAFRPSEDQHGSSDSLGGAASSSLWGAIGQSLSFSNNNTSAAASTNTSRPDSSIEALWTFGNFDVDALTADKKEDHPYGYRNESRLSSAFGNLDLGSRGGNQGLRYGSQQREEYGGREDYYGRGGGGGGGPGYDAIPRWTPGGGAGQMSYGYQGYGAGGGELP